MGMKSEFLDSRTRTLNNWAPGFIGGNYFLPKVASLANLKATKYISEGKLILGKSLKFSLPFLSRVTTGFVAYDLVKQIQNYNKGNKEALVNIAGDGLIISVDVAEVGIELAELGGVIEGVSSVTGPIGMTMGAIVFVGLDIYSAVKSVEKNWSTNTFNRLGKV